MLNSKLDIYNSFFDEFDEFINSRDEEIKAIFINFSHSKRLDIKRRWSLSMTNQFIEENELEFNKHDGF
jgi:hypothetical protein